ncbi:mandelate racemase [Phycicoccus sp. MAQZ13P-2]|nr:mandelate racemase [Phycicoccus mangrovi]MBT9273181.1 mandelate racemase [Phycicoccus mangrovi]
MVSSLEANVYEVPLEEPESDGTLTWDSTTIVVVEARADGRSGIGYTYAPRAAAAVVEDTLAAVVTGRDPMAVGAAWGAMAHAVRNQGRRGPVSAAISAVDIALWDLKARLVGRPLVDVLGGYHDHVIAYGSGGFTNLTDEALTAQVRAWTEQGLPAVKVKVGSDPADDPRRVALVREAVGAQVEVFVDANGAYHRKQALLLAERFAEHGVRWFEEPVTSDDLDGLRLLRDRAPAGMEVTAGEYGWDVTHARRLLDAGAVDCVQADVTRVGGITGLLRVAALADAHGLDLSAHCAPQLSAHALTAVWHARHLEYFADHVRLEAMVFDGVLQPVDGALRPDRARPGHGLDVRWADIERYRTRPEERR